MEFKKLNIDGVALMADLVSREARARAGALAAALRRIEIVEEGSYGVGRQDIRLTIALAPGVETAVDTRWHDRDATLSEMVEDVGQLVDAAERIFDDRQSAIEMLKEVRTTLSREVAKARRRGLPYRTLDLSLTPCEAASYDLPAVTIGIEVIGSLLAAGRHAFDVECAEDVVRTFAEMREDQEQLLAMRERLARVGGDVMIDSVTLAALEDAGISPAKAIADLQNSDVPIIDIDVRHGRMVLYIKNAVVTGNVALGDGMRWQEGRLIVPKARGVSLAGVKGKPLNQLVAHPYFSDHLTIASVSEFSDSLWVHVLLPQPVALSLDETRMAA